MFDDNDCFTNSDSNSFKVLPYAVQILAKAVTALQNPVGVSVLIEGHTEDTAGYSYNKLLSDSCTKTMLEFLVAYGIDKGTWFQS